jgi:uncharacterized protein (TIGR03435 family)
VKILEVGFALALLVSSAASAVGQSFEVSSVRENNSVGGRSHIWSASDNPTFRTENVPLLALLQFAYDMPDTRILDLPEPIRSKKFDIDAKADSMIDAMKAMSGDAGKLRKQQMLQALLAERFKLAVHRETRQLPVYALVAAKGGPKLQPTKGGGLYVNHWNNRLQATGMTTDQIARELAKSVGRVVIDKTGIAGRYDVDLRWTPEEDAARVAGNADAPPGIFTALQEQMGLKLEPEKGPVEVLVVEHVEMPTAN